MSAALRPAEVARLRRAEARWLEQAWQRIQRTRGPRPTRPVTTRGPEESR